jgi:hypothetical protein
MTTSRGILYHGEPVPLTERVLREDGAWWQSGERGTLVRDQPADLLVGHWTAGNPHEGPGTAKRVVRAMKARLREDGLPMAVGVHFVIGWDGMIFQTADLGVGTIHVSRGWNHRSIGVECCSPGTAEQAARLGVDGKVERRTVAGRRSLLLRPSQAMLDAWVWLADALGRVLPIPARVPLDRDGSLLVDRMTAKSARGWCGAAEHLHSPSTTKIDHGGYLVGALRDAGWRGVAA